LLIKKMKVNTLLPGDKSAVVINARKNAYGPDYKIQVVCESCFKQNEHVVDLENVGPKEVKYEDIQFTDKGTFIIKLPRTAASVELKFMTSEDEKKIEERAKQKSEHNLPETPASDRLRQLIVSVDGNESVLVIGDFVSKLPIADSLHVKRKYTQVVPDIDFTYEFPCSECEHANKGNVPIAGDFFWPDEGLY